MISEEKPLFDHLMQQALQASQDNKGEVAVALFLEASQLAPQAPLPHFLLAAEYMELGRVQEAEGAYANTILLAPDLAIARFQLGLLQFTSARASMAMLTWQPLLSLEDGDALRLFVEGFAALAQDDFKNALAFMQSGVDANHSNPPLNRDISRVIEEIRKLHDGKLDLPESGEGGNQFLLAHYQQRGALH